MKSNTAQLRLLDKNFSKLDNIVLEWGKKLICRASSVFLVMN